MKKIIVFVKLVKCTRRGKLDSCVPFAHFCSGVVSAWCRLLSYNIASGHLLRKWPLTRWPIDLFKKEPLKGNSEVHLHTPSKFGEDPSKDLGGVGKQTNKQTDKRCSNYSMMMISWWLFLHWEHKHMFFEQCCYPVKSKLGQLVRVSGW